MENFKPHIRIKIASSTFFGSLIKASFVRCGDENDGEEEQRWFSQAGIWLVVKVRSVLSSRQAPRYLSSANEIFSQPCPTRTLSVKLSWYTTNFFSHGCHVALYIAQVACCATKSGHSKRRMFLVPEEVGADLKDHGKQMSSPYLFPGFTQKGCVI